MKIQNAKIRGFIVVLLGCFLLTDNAQAMHISEGILPWNWAVLWFVLAAPFIAVGLHRLKKLSNSDLSFKPLVGLMAAVVFIISCMPIPVPTAGTCSHPCGTGDIRDTAWPLYQHTDYRRGTSDSGPFPGPWRIEHLGREHLFHGCDGFFGRIFNL